MAQQRLGFSVGICGGGNDNVKTPVFINLVEINLWENDMFFNSQRIIAAAVKTFCRHTPILPIFLSYFDL